MKNLYLLLGEEAQDIDDKISELFSKSKREFDNIEKKHLWCFDEDDINSAISDILTPSLFGTAYFIVLDCAEQLTEKNAERLAKNIAICNEDSYLVIRSCENKVSAKIEKLVSPSNKKIFYLMPDAKRRAFVRELFSSSGYKIADSALESFLSFTQDDKKSIIKKSSELINALKAVSYAGELTDEQVFKFSSFEAEREGFDMFYYLARRDVNALITQVESSLSSNPRGFMSILPGLIISTRRAIAWMKSQSKDSWVVEYVSGFKTVIRNPGEKSNIMAFSKNYSLSSAQKLLSYLLEAEVRVRHISVQLFQKIYFEATLARLVSR